MTAPELHVAEPVPFVREGAERFLEGHQAPNLDAQLPLASGHDGPLGAQPVAEIRRLEGVRHSLAGITSVDEQLNRATPVAKRPELELAERPLQHQPPCHRDVDLGVLTRAQVAKPLLQGSGEIGPVEAMGIATGVEDRLMALAAERSLGVGLLLVVSGHRVR